MGAASNGAADDGWVNVPPHDGTLEHVWFFEPKLERRNVLSQSGLENIANHQYVPGTYTFLDNALNPIWMRLTDMLPMWLAPNAVTTFGGLHCGLAYFVLWQLSPNFDKAVPDWALFLAGYCTIAYYTLDCMDGKQARRTGSSSPLGQLFDHGFDCICNMAHCAISSAYLMNGGTKWYFLQQCTLQYSFFMAQWEEYYTHILPHSSGQIGVTEVNYGLGLLTILMGFIDREAFWTQPLKDILPYAASSCLPPQLVDLEMRYVSSVGWACMVSVLIMLSFIRVFTHLDSGMARFNAACNLLSPLIVGICPFLLPDKYIQDNTRYISVAAGLLFSHITKKQIVYSMAKMCFASIQLDVLPFLFTCLWIRYDERLTEEGGFLVIRALCIWHAFRLMHWAGIAINQICKRLDIWCLRIKHKKKTS